MNNVPDDRFVEVRSGGSGYVQQSSYIYEDAAERFVKDARKHHDRGDRPSAPSVPMHQYYPTFQGMSEQQGDWYFHWRHNARNNQYLDTDLSYIIVYVYEILCLVEFAKPAEAVQKIKSLWMHYRKSHPEIDNYLPGWGGDLLAAQVGVDEMIDWWKEIVQSANIQYPSEVVNVLIQRLVNEGKGDQVPYSILATINMYKPQNKFVDRYNQDGSVTKVYEKAIAAVNAHLTGLRSKKTLVERYCGSSIYPQRRRLFTSALVPRSFKRDIIVGEAKNYATNGRLGIVLSSITKHAENMMRKQLKFSARLSGYEIEPKLQAVIEAALAPAPEPVKITINKKRAADLRKESDQVAIMLETETGVEHDVKPLYSDIALVRQVWSVLSPSAHRLIAAVLQKTVKQVGQIPQGLIHEGLSLAEVIDQINDASLPVLGDQLISIERKVDLKLAEDFEDEISLIISEASAGDFPQSSTTAKSGEAGAKPSGQSQQGMAPENVDLSATNSLSQEYQRFLRGLTQGEMQMLAVHVNSGPLSEDQVNQIARAFSQMGSVMMDVIGEKAIEQLGRNPFYLENDAWRIEEEDLTAFRNYFVVQGSQNGAIN